ncbi:hypothetical protein [Bradyrhizobium lablabi]|uniref:hypothetical protein n=1 Tax=Bradyrhizobium lablabi TaxID=722472 RepID=UPI001BAC9477|nr:hypothetical protein [Bradyrhizobium lablabi]MBR0693639.1 hypothetical protein [Bradyrhizobium lablabi]
MGMDVIGKKPSTEEGKYFRNNVWWWRPLAGYCCEVAPEITSKCTYWQSNDGDGLGKRDAIKLADVLQKEIESGRTLSFQRRYTSAQEMTANEPCPICAGTGTRLPVPHRGAGDPKTTGIKCNGCDGNGTRRPYSTDYPFDVENVQKFVAFLRGCGGFQIC